MDRILRVFCAGSEQTALAKAYKSAELDVELLIRSAKEDARATNAQVTNGGHYRAIRNPRQGARHQHLATARY